MLGGAGDQTLPGLTVELGLVAAAHQQQTAGGDARRIVQPADLTLFAGKIPGFDERLYRCAGLIGQGFRQGGSATEWQNQTICFQFRQGRVANCVLHALS